MAQHIQIKIIFGLCLLANVFFWSHFRSTQAEWLNVPPVPSERVAVAFGFGDEQFAYRNIALMIQNLGDSGGRSRSLDDYNYEELAKWLELQYELDDRSKVMPYLAAYYFGAVQTPQKLVPVIAYLENVGSVGVDEKWRWLAQAIYLARYRLEDMDWALRMAGQLSALQTKIEDMPVWAKNMHVMLMSASGEKEAALDIMLQTLESERDKMEPQEILFIADYICNQILTPSESAQMPLCIQLENQ
mgnify:CR=1 FL=1